MSYGLRHRLRVSGLRHGGVDRPRRWLGRPMMTMTGWAIALVAVILVAWMLRSIYVVFFLRRPWSVPPNDDTLCRGVDVSCGAISGWITSLLSIALASVVFLFWRFWGTARGPPRPDPRAPPARRPPPPPPPRPHRARRHPARAPLL